MSCIRAARPSPRWPHEPPDDDREPQQPAPAPSGGRLSAPSRSSPAAQPHRPRRSPSPSAHPRRRAAPRRSPARARAHHHRPAPAPRRGPPDGSRAPDGRTFDLELERIDVERRRFGLAGQRRHALSEILDGTAVSVWKGQIAGDPFSDGPIELRRPAGCARASARCNTVAADGGWFAAPSVLQYEDALNAAGSAFHQAECLGSAAGGLAGPEHSGARASGARSSPSRCASARSPWRPTTSSLPDLERTSRRSPRRASRRRAELHQRPLRGADLHGRPSPSCLRFWTTRTILSPRPDNGGNSIDMLNEFVAAWQGNIPMNATLGHMMSGAYLGGGVAYLDAPLQRQLQLPSAAPSPAPWLRRAAAVELGLQGRGPRARPQLRVAAHPRLLPAAGCVRAQRVCSQPPVLSQVCRTPARS